MSLENLLKARLNNFPIGLSSTSPFFWNWWVDCRYLREYQALGTAGGLYLFRDAILKGDPKTIIVMHADVCCSFPLEEMLAMHKEKQAIGTILGTKVFPNPLKKSLTRSLLKQLVTMDALYPIQRPMKYCITSKNLHHTFPPRSIAAFTFSTRHYSDSFVKS